MENVCKEKLLKQLKKLIRLITSRPATVNGFSYEKNSLSLTYYLINC